MKIVHATWENRNLGCEAYEIALDRSDMKNFDATLQEIRAQDFSGAYVTLKMPVGDLKALHALEDDGFRFMETQFRVGRSLQNYETPDILKRYQNLLTREEVPKIKSEWQKVIDLITPDMFTTDRIYLDPKLKPGMSCTRYKNWIADSVDKDGLFLFVYQKESEPIGFGFYRFDRQKQTGEGILGGAFEKYQNGLYGLVLHDLYNRENKKIGLKHNSVTVSSNNLNMMKCYNLFGYIIEDSCFVLRKF